MTELAERLAAALGASYRLERELGGGGMSRVFVAEETGLGRKVVLKVLPPDFGAGLSPDRFRREIQLAASLHHPHIVPLLAAGEADGLLFYTMPFIEGESLRAKLAREGELPVAETLRILKEVVDALAYAHEQGVVHRDIKPDNILLSRHHAAVTDFGVAKALSASSGTGSMLTSAGLALGTPAYMAPEQATADPHVDHRADIYAVGALAYEMLTGRPPFTAPTPQAVLAAQVTKAPESVSMLRPACPAALAEVVMRCLEKRPADRWQSAEELLGQLESLATPSFTTPTTPASPLASERGSPSQAAPASSTPGPAPTVTRASTWRRGALVALGVAGLIVLGAGVLRLWERGPAGSGSASGAKKLVVLPFENLGAPDDQYFADGITEEITSRLATVPAILVTSRTTAMQYKGAKKTARQIGQELGVGYVLEGTVRWDKAPGTRGPSRVRVTPQLIRVGDDSHLWADRYDADLADIFTVQSRMAEQVVGALGVALGESQRQTLAAQPTRNPEAYDAYLRGQAHYDRLSEPGEDFAAVRSYEQAVALDSSFALAWAALGRAHAFLYWGYSDRTMDRLQLARQAVDRALYLQPDLPQAHIAKGYYLYWGLRNYGQALEELDRARRVLPNDADLTAGIARIQRRQGKWEAAVDGLRRAVELDPHSVALLIDLAQAQRLTRAWTDADRTLARAVELSPDAPGAYGERINIYLAWEGDTARAKAAYRQAVARRGSEAAYLIEGLGFVAAQDPALQAEADGLRLTAGMDTLFYLNFKADHYRLRGAAGQARVYYDSLITRLVEHVKRAPDDDLYHSFLGWAYARIGRKADAIREGRKAVDLLPHSRDAWSGMNWVINLAAIYANTGEADLAVEQLRIALAGPSDISVALLRIDPTWDQLRKNPRFQALLAKQ